MNGKIVCGRCGAQNLVGAAFCYNCGMKFEYVCPNCRQPVNAGTPVCNRCGNTLVWSTDGTTSQSSSKPFTIYGGGSKRSKYVTVSIVVILLVAVVAGGLYAFYRYGQSNLPVIPQSTENKSEEKGEPAAADNKPPIISDITVRKLSGTAVEILWTTDEESTTQIIWHVKDGSTITTPQKEALVKQHSVDLTGLNPDKKYYFVVRSVDKFGNESVSPEKSFDFKVKSEVATIDVLMHTLTAEEKPDGVHTFVRGQIINTGDVAVEVKNIRVTVSVNVPGKSGMIDIPADLDYNSGVLSPGGICRFVAPVPNGTQPGYRVRVAVDYQE